MAQLNCKEQEKTYRAFDNYASESYEKGDYNKALEYYIKALNSCKSIFGENHPAVAISYNNIANTYKMLGDWKTALEYYQKSLDILTTIYGENQHPSIAITYCGIADTYQTTSNYDKALEYYKKALKLLEKVLGKEHPSTGSAYNNVALVYQASHFIKTRGTMKKL